MKKHIMMICLLWIAGIAAYAQSGTNKNANTSNDTLRILAIGNSFSVDGLAYLQQIAEVAGYPVIIGNLYIPGCSLERHYQNTLTDAKPYRYYKNVCGTKSEADFSLHDGVTDEYWDVISFQQSSPFSGKYESYEPYLSSLREYVKAHALNASARQVWHMTWAYAADSDRKAFADYGNDQKKMYKAIKKATRKLMRQHRFDAVIASGETVNECRKSKIGDHLTRDGYHLNKLGRFAAGCTWYVTLFQQPVCDNPYKPESVNEEEAEIARKAAEKSCRRYR